MSLLNATSIDCHSRAGGNLKTPACAGVTSFITAFTITALILFTSASAFTVEQTLPPAQEKIAQQIFSEIRCMVCTGESIAESNADMALDMRGIIRQKVEQGQSAQQVKDYFVTRYGQQILQTPPLDKTTYALWVLPFALLAAFGFIIILKSSRRKKS